VIFEDFRSADYLGYDIIEDKVGIFIFKVREGRFFGGIWRGILLWWARYS
jgi:excinuclease ABC subunit C